MDTAIAANEEKVVPPAALCRTTSMRSATSLVSSMGSSDDGAPFSNQLAAYELQEVIGFGASAMVYSATFKPDGRRVAVKIIDLDAFERTQIDQLRREIQNLSLCRHPNVLRTYGSFVDNTKLYIVTPYLAGGSCLDIMRYAHPDGFEESTVATILKQALSGLVYMHRQGFIHRDVKAGNMLLDNDGTVMLADFGVSSSLMETGERRCQRKTFVGTPCWMAPEVMEQSPYDTKADIWSFGITCLELATGNAPYAKYPPLKVLMLTLNNDPPTLDRDKTRHKYSRTFKDLIDLCLQKDPTKRPSAEKLLQHSFFTKAKKPQHICASLLKGLAPLETRQLKAPSQKQQALQRSVSWDFSEDKPYLEDTDETGEHLSEESRIKGVRFDSNAHQLLVNSLSSSNEATKEKKGRFLINADDDDEDEDEGNAGDHNHQSYIDIDRLANSIELNLTTSMELMPDGDGNKIVSVQKGRFSVTEDSDDDNNNNNNDSNNHNDEGSNNQSQHRRNQSQTVDNYPVHYNNQGNLVNNPANELLLSTSDMPKPATTTTATTALHSSHRLSTDLDVVVASLEASSRESISLSRQNSSSSNIPPRPRRWHTTSVLTTDHVSLPTLKYDQPTIDADNRSEVSSQLERRGRFEVTSDDTEDDSEAHMYPADGVSLPSPTHSPMPRYYSSLYSSSTHAHSSIDRSHHPDDMAAVGVQAQLDALHRQGEIQRAMLANLCQQLGVNRSNADTTTNRATIDTSSPSVLLSTLATLQQQLSVALQENVALQSENSHLRRELDQIEQLVTRTRSSLSVNTQSLTTANSISSLNNNTSSSYNSPNPLHRSYRSNPSNPSDTLT